MQDHGQLAKTLMDSETTPAPAPRKGSKKAPRRTSKPATLQALCAAYIEALPALGKSSGTQRSYRADLAVAGKHFDDELDPKTLTPEMVAAFFDSDRVTKGRDGKEKSAITVAKIRRVFRLMLVWAAEAGHLKTAPLPDRAATAPSKAKRSKPKEATA